MTWRPELLALLVAVFLVSSFAEQDDLPVWEVYTSCEIPNESTKGICVDPLNCPAFQHITSGQQLGEIGRLSFVRALQCLSENETLICCPKTGDYVQPELSLNVTKRNRNANLTVATRFGENEECGQPSDQVKIAGLLAEIDEFPWAALLFYRNDYQGCGGVMISSRFVLTAAHCLTGRSYDQFGPLEYVRLGEYDTLRDPDCVVVGQYMDCNEGKIDARPQSIKVHPDYVSNSAQQHHDIGLIKLDREVPVTDFISPICLPEPRFRAGPEKSQTFSVCGWGRTDFFEINQKSPVKMKASLPYVEPQVCEGTYRSERLSLGPGQLCAGGKRNNDSCAGDSGSPLMFYDRSRNSWVLIGIVSRGPASCGKENKPGIYTNVKKYLPWIQANAGL